MHAVRFPRLLTLLLTVLLAAPAFAQSLMTPDDFLGYELGSRFTWHHRVVDYFEHVDEASPNVQLVPYGETYEGRPLMVAVVSTAENLANLDAIRLNNLRRAGMADGEIEGPSASIVWLSYNVHGNESVSTEAVLPTLYDLANTGNARTQAWLENTIVILDPCINPDGRNRYANWYNETVGRFPNVNPDAREHREPWPGGRTNHYHFDLNRDWAWATQQETQQRLKLYHEWMPHVHVDFHEQGVNSPYYFAPAAEPLHEDITPWQRELQTAIGVNHTTYFDAESWLYFTRQVFDLLYPGYGDTWPTFNGAVGMTYEQGGSGRAGVGILTAEGDTLTLSDRIAHHYTTGLSTIEATVNNHDRVLSEFEAYYDRAESTPPGRYKTFVVKGSNDPDKLAAFEAHLTHQGIEFGYAGRTRSSRGLHYASGDNQSFDVEFGDVVISVHQPKAVLTKVLMEPETTVADSLTYDITAWALPYVYDLDAYALTERLNPDAEPAGRALPAPPELERPYAYLAEWKSLADMQFLVRLLAHDIKLRYATDPFELDGQMFDRGTLLITRTGNTHLGDRFDAIVRETAETMRQPLHATATGLVTSGDDFGSNDVPYLKKPEVLVLTNTPVSSYAAGEIWHFFDQTLAFPVTMLDANDLGRIDLDDYDVLVLPSGSYGSVLTDSRLNDVKTWVRGGGRLIALEGAARFLAGKDGFDLKRKSDDEDSNGEEEEEPVQRRYGDRAREGVTDDVPGAIYRIQLDNTHPLAFGFDDSTFLLKRSSSTYAWLEGNSNWNVGVVDSDDHVAGFVGHKVKDTFDATLSMGVQQMGSGTVTYLLDPMLFRAFWYNGQMLFGNAVFLVGQR